jgi:hypothetical protein
LEPWSNILKEALHQFIAAEVGKRQSARVRSILFSQGYNTVSPTTQLFRFRIRRTYLLAEQERFDKVAHQGFAVGCCAVELSSVS